MKRLGTFCICCLFYYHHYIIHLCFSNYLRLTHEMMIDLYVLIHLSKYIVESWLCSTDGRLHCHFDGLMQERHNSSALAMELCLSCINPLI